MSSGTGPDGILPPPPHPDPPPRRTTSGLAILSLVLGIAGFLVITIPVNLVLGIAALIRAGETGQKGRGLASAGIALSVLWVGVLCVGLTAYTMMNPPDVSGLAQDGANPSEPPPSASASPSPAGKPDYARVTWDDLKVGDCFEPFTEDEVETVQLVSCKQRPRILVYAIVPLPYGPWPGQAQLDNISDSECSARLESSRPAERELSDMLYFTPTKLGWSLGDRRIICGVQPVVPSPSAS